MQQGIYDQLFCEVHIAVRIYTASEYLTNFLWFH